MSKTLTREERVEINRARNFRRRMAKEARRAQEAQAQTQARVEATRRISTLSATTRLAAAMSASAPAKG